MTFGSLFAGIGGFDLGFERAGMTCKWQVEIDPYCQKVLAKHWPHVRRHDDVRTFPPEGDWNVDVICGGFPCQDVSNAGKRAGITGERSGLWAEYVRIIRHLRPRYVVVENVAALLVRGMGQVLWDLADCGMDAEWDVLPAGAVGMVHLRKRLFVVAYSGSERMERQRHGQNAPLAAGGLVPNVSPFVQSGIREWIVRRLGSCANQPLLRGRDHGVSDWVERTRAIGNAVCPDVAEFIGRRLIGAST